MDTNDTKEVKDAGEAQGATEPAPVENCTEQQAGEVAGGAGDCTTTFTIGTGGVGISGTYQGGNILISAYEGAVDATSHVMERVSNAVKQ